MNAPLLKPIGNRSVSDRAYFISGNVTVHPSAAIAPDVLLQADPDSALVIDAGVCIGAGAVLHAHGGALRIEEGVSLGAEVLVIGTGVVGARACVGTAATLISPQVLPEAMVAPRSLIGDTSRQVVEFDGAPETKKVQSGAPASTGVEPPVVQQELPKQEAIATQPSYSSNPQQNGGAVQNGQTVPAQTPSVGMENGAALTNGQASSNGVGLRPVYGKDAVERLMTSLFPHRQMLNAKPENPSN